MSCRNCASMARMHLPTCREEIAALAYKDCDSPSGPGAFMTFLDARFPEDHTDRDFGGHWAQLAHVRREHIEFHRRHGGTCDRITALLGEQKDEAGR